MATTGTTRMRTAACGVAAIGLLLSGCAGSSGVQVTTDPTTEPPTTVPDAGGGSGGGGGGGGGGGEGHATLRVWQGLDLASGDVVASTDPAAGLTFILNPNRITTASLDTPGGHLMPITGDTVDDGQLRTAPPYLDSGIVPGTVFAVASAAGPEYAVRIDDFANQGQGDTHWRLDVSWAPLRGG